MTGGRKKRMNTVGKKGTFEKTKSPYWTMGV